MGKEKKHFYEFGPYRIDPDRQLLLRLGEPVPLTSKAFETLLVLVQHREQVVSKDELMKLLWPNTFVEESNLTQHVSLLRKALGESPQDRRYVVTMPGRGYRFAERVKEISGEDEELVLESHSTQTVTVEECDTQRLAAGVTLPLPKLRSKIGIWIFASIAFVALCSILLLRLRRVRPMNEGDLVLVSDFVNTTGEPVFDGSLKQAVSVKLAESPYFNLALNSATRQTLSMMGRSADERVVPPIAREICQREGAKVVVGGSIISLGEKYALELNAFNCLTGESLARQEIEAPNRDQVLSKLGNLIPPLRRRLGESVSTIEKFDTPIEQATTKSLAALKAYTSGDQKRVKGQESESVSFYKMAIELDPDFAMAYATLGTVYMNLSQRDLADEYLRNAFERREHVSEKEKFYIQSRYYEATTKDISKAIETYTLWTEVYPHDFSPFNSLSSAYLEFGQLDKAISVGQQALRVNPSHALAYATLGRAYERATRFAEAKVICERAKAEKTDSFWTHQLLYRIAFAEGDSSAMQREIDWFKGKPQESQNTYYQAKAALSLGEVRKARELFERARELALQQGLKEQATAIINGHAQFEAELNNDREARTLAAQSLREATNPGRHMAYATLALARAGEVKHAEALLNELDKQPSLGTAMNSIILPSIRAAIDLDRRNPAAAIEELRPVLPYDLGQDASGATLYYRGLAYLGLKSGKDAAAQFQKILDNRGIVMTDVYWPLAQLGLARTYAMEEEAEKARAAYKDFFALWNGADPEIPILIAAKSEYAKLK